MRNYKLWNHWIAEVRDIGLFSKVYFQDEDFQNGIWIRNRKLGLNLLKL